MIDSHQHFWRIDRGDYGWLTPALAPIHRDFGPSDLQPILARHRISRTIVVQAAPTLAETGYLLDIAARTSFVAGVVGWVDFEAHDAPATIAQLATNARLVGLRPMVQDLPDDDWLARPSLTPAFEAMIDNDLVFDALVLPKHLDALHAVLVRHPALRVVVDHAAKPELRERTLGPWHERLARIADHPQVVCKLSGLVTEAAPDAGLDVLAPVIDALIAMFGTDRLLWGSDWPVVELAGGYDRWRTLTEQALVRLDDAARRNVFGDNAARVYLRER